MTKGEYKRYQDLLIWQKAMDLVTEIYASTRHFPCEQLYGLISQMRRCAVSLPSYITEGQGRNSSTEFKRFSSISRGSLYELKTQIDIASRLSYCADSTRVALNEHSNEIERMLNSFISKLPSN